MDPELLKKIKEIEYHLQVEGFESFKVDNDELAPVAIDLALRHHKWKNARFVIEVNEDFITDCNVKQAATRFANMVKHLFYHK